MNNQRHPAEAGRVISNENLTPAELREQGIAFLGDAWITANNVTASELMLAFQELGDPTLTTLSQVHGMTLSYDPNKGLTMELSAPDPALVEQNIKPLELTVETYELGNTRRV